MPFERGRGAISQVSQGTLRVCCHSPLPASSLVGSEESPNIWSSELSNLPRVVGFKQQIGSWLVVSTPLKNISQWEGLSHILWKIKNVPNHQPGRDFTKTINFHYIHWDFTVTKLFVQSCIWDFTSHKAAGPSKADSPFRARCFPSCVNCDEIWDTIW